MSGSRVAVVAEQHEVVAELAALPSSPRCTSAVAGGGDLAELAELVAAHVGHVAQVAREHDTRRSMPGSR